MGLVTIVSDAAVRWALLLAVLYLVAGAFYTRHVLQSSFLLCLFLAGFSIRAVLAFVLYFTHPPDGHIFPDDLYYMRTGLTILEQWRGGQFLNLDMYRLAAHSRNWGYSLYNAVHYLMTPSHLLPSISNAFAGALLGIAVYRLALELLNSVKVARIAAILATFHSGFIWYSSVNLKDSLVALTIVLTLLYGARAVRHHMSQDLLKMIGSAVVLFTLRFYMAPFVLGFIVLYWFLHSRVRLYRKILLAGFLVGSALLLASILPGVETTLKQIERSGGIFNYITIQSEEQLEKVQIKEKTILSRLKQLNIYEKMILAIRFILNPSPFNLHDITWLLLPGILLWYMMLPLVVAGGLRLIVRSPVTAILLLGLMIAGILLYAQLPNVHMRHRFQFTPIAMIIAAWSLVHPWRHQLVLALMFFKALIFALGLMKLGLLMPF